VKLDRAPPKKKMGAVESQAAIRWNNPRHPQARDSFGAVPAVAPVVGVAQS